MSLTARAGLVITYGSIAVLLMVAASVRAQAPRAVVDPALAEASRALAAGEADRAFLLGTKYLERHPGDVRAQVLLVRVHMDRGEWDDAYRMANRAARAHPGDVDVLYYLGLVTRRQAADQFEHLVRMAPDSARVHQLQAEMLEAQERRADAEKEYVAALEAKPDLLEALLGLGKLKRIRLACEEAIHLYDKAESIRPTFDAAYGRGRQWHGPAWAHRSSSSGVPLKASRSCSARSPSSPRCMKHTTCSAWRTRRRAMRHARRTRSRRPSSCAAPVEGQEDRCQPCCPA
jgi:Flp pilus assembly protein TadD